jgi:hypothetical protein
LACDQHCCESTTTVTQLKSNFVNRGLANIDKRPAELQRAQEDGFNKVLKRLSSGNTWGEARSAVGPLRVSNDQREARNPGRWLKGQRPHQGVEAVGTVATLSSDQTRP